MRNINESIFEAVEIFSDSFVLINELSLAVIQLIFSLLYLTQSCLALTVFFPNIVFSGALPPHSSPLCPQMTKIMDNLVHSLCCCYSLMLWHVVVVVFC